MKSSPLTAEQKETIIELLASGLSIQQVASQQGIRRERISQLINKEPWSSRLVERRDEKQQEYRDALRLLIPSAIKALKDILTGSNKNAACRAALEILRSTSVIQPTQPDIPNDQQITLDFGLPNNSPEPLESDSNLDGGQ